MKDVRKHAEAKLKQKNESTTSNQGFLSEREKAKQALCQELSSFDGRSVQKIAAIDTKTETTGLLNTCAYCRVSTGDIDQVISIELQKNNYRDMIDCTFTREFH